MPNTDGYLVSDLLRENLRVIFCGTAPSRASVAAGAYYAKPGNRFWRSLHDVGLTPRRFVPAEYPSLLELGFGLTDLCKLHSGTDAQLPKGAFDLPAFEAKLLRYAPRVVAFTSKNAAQAFLGKPVAYGLQAHRGHGPDIFVLTSPSGLATRFFDIRVWQDLALRVRG
jgi:double-stranded uracil-DNA glycosylase